MNDLFDLDLLSTESLREEERLTLIRLLIDGEITEAQAQQALEIHERHRTPLLAILGSMGIISQQSYARNLSQATETGYASELLGSENFDYDKAFVRQFDPAVLMRALFCPLRCTDDLVVVMAVYPNDVRVTELVQEVVPGAEVVALAGTEINVTRLVDGVFQRQLSYQAVFDLRARRPTESASQVFTGAQILGAFGLMLALVAGLVWHFWLTLSIIVAVVNVFYFISISYKLVLSLVGSLDPPARPSDAALDLSDAELPLYSILVPVYKEPEVVPTLLQALSRLDYPAEKLDVLLLMEEDDLVTIGAAKAAHPPSFFRFIYVPKSLPRTKPKACNYGLSFCRGDYVTIFDAEDIPEPDQLKKALRAFLCGPANQVCVQAALNYFNSDENYLTRMFTLEYSYWFDYMLPGLDRLRLPIPLGGTSNHFRLDLLRDLGGWDPFNVTEDADLGIRASARGYTVGVIRSTTYEEANKALGNWIRQRSRWIKGYMQTWLVHNRHPLSLLKVLGLKNWVSYQFFIGGTCATFLANPVMWVLYVAQLLFHSQWATAPFAGWLLWLAAFNFLVGNMLGIYLNMLAVFRRRLFHLTPFALTNPLYWWLHSIAAYLALWQLFTKPFYWEKTQHGLTNVAKHSPVVSTSHG
jgi:glycosyltransferase XagB